METASSKATAIQNILLKRIRVSVVLIALVPVVAIAASPQEIARRTFPSVVLLVMKDRHGQSISIGSGFFVARNTIATNLHVVRGASSGHAKLVGREAAIPLEGLTVVDERLDLALVRAALDAPPLVMADSATVEVGETVFAVGNPQGLEGTFSQGIVSGIRHLSDVRLIQITAPVSPGSSGGPVLNSRGEVIGVAVATLKGGQNLNFAVAGEALSRLLARQGSTKPLWSLTGRTPTETTADQKSEPRKKQTSEDKSRREGIEGSNLRSAVTGHSFAWTKGRIGRDNRDHFGVSIQNRLSVRVIDVKGILVFYSASGLPLHYQELYYGDPIAPGLAVRIERSLGADVRGLAKRIEIRVLDFLPLDDQGECEYLRRARTRFKLDKEVICRTVSISLEKCEKCIIEQ